MILIDGKQLAASIRQQIKNEIIDRGLYIGLATILVGDDVGSKIYVEQKIKFCKEVGIESYAYKLSSTTTEEELISLIHELNYNPKVHGILLQLPLPSHINPDKVIRRITPKKDVDGFHPNNLGRILTCKKWSEIITLDAFIPCTPHGIITMLESIKVDFAGKKAVIVGRSSIVGKPLGILLLSKDCTVEWCHTKTKELEKETLSADILIAACGSPKLIKANMVKEGAIVIDVGVNRIGKTDSGKDILCGDVEFETVKDKVYAISPVPGGVGPMTIAMLLKNTLKAGMM